MPFYPYFQVVDCGLTIHPSDNGFAHVPGIIILYNIGLHYTIILPSGAAVAMAFIDSHLGIGLATLHTTLINITKLTQLDTNHIIHN